MKETHYHCLPSQNGLKFFEGAVSRQIKLLENQLNVIIFHRAHRKLNLTEQGRILARVEPELKGGQCLQTVAG
nr:LysR family transcriptional regulator [uncultured Desulfobacter sp.]